MFTVYVIQSKSTAKIYIGQTKDYKERLKRHNKELPYNPKGYTAKNKGPWNIVYKESFKIRSEAVTREKFLKSHAGRDYLKRILAR